MDYKHQLRSAVCTEGRRMAGARALWVATGMKPDGMVGPVTLQAINTADQQDLFNRLWLRRKKFFLDLVDNSVKEYERRLGRKATERELLKYTQKRFLKGWLNRLNSFEFEE